MTVPTEVIAQVCHEANRVLQAYFGESVSVPWQELDAETADSAIVGVENALGGTTPEGSHECWLAFKRDHGWSYGETKDEGAKTHPCMVPYDQLPPKQQLKDHLFIQVVEALA